MVRIRHILDPELRKRVVEQLAANRGCPPSAIPDWFELDDADYTDLLMQISHSDEAEDQHDSRM